MTFTATVAAVSPGAGTPSGTVNFLEGSTTLASSVALNGSDQATFTTSSLALGTHTVTAAYSGDTDFQASTTTTAAVQTVGAGATSTVVTQPTTNVPASGGTDTFFHQAATFTATVTSTNGGTPTGHVAFLDGTTTLASGVSFFLSSGDMAQASFTTSTLSVGAHTITAVYTDDVDSNFTTSTSPNLIHTVDADTTTTDVSPPITNVTTTGGQSNSSFNPTVTFTATVTSGHGGTPTGTVQFLANGTDIGTPQTVISNGVPGEGEATFADALTASSSPQTITAQYVNSDGNFQGSTDTTGVILGQVESNGSAEITNSNLSLTQGKNGQAGSGFFNVKQDITSFTTTFSFQLEQRDG